jgi:hypothetical protein
LDSLQQSNARPSAGQIGPISTYIEIKKAGLETKYRLNFFSNQRCDILAVQQGKWWLVPDSETEINGDSSEVHLSAGVLSWLVRWGRRAGTREFCPALVGPIKKNQHRSHVYIFLKNV